MVPSRWARRPPAPSSVRPRIAASSASSPLSAIPRAGVKSLAESLDTVGGFARSVPDIALFASVLMRDPRMLDLNYDAKPRIGMYRSLQWRHAQAETKEAYAQAAAILARAGAQVEEVPQPPAGDCMLVQLHADIMAYEASQSLAYERLEHAAQLSAKSVLMRDPRMLDLNYDAKPRIGMYRSCNGVTRRPRPKLCAGRRHPGAGRRQVEVPQRRPATACWCSCMPTSWPTRPRNAGLRTPGARRAAQRQDPVRARSRRARITAEEHQRNLARAARAAPMDLWFDRYDVLLTPSASEAPFADLGTGDPVLARRLDAVRPA